MTSTGDRFSSHSASSRGHRTRALSRFCAGAAGPARREHPADDRPHGTFVGRAEAGLVRVLAVTSLERIPALPDVPTLSETPGFEGFEATGFVGVVAPAATPRPVIAR